LGEPQIYWENFKEKIAKCFDIVEW
jgi:hypothetical protein